LPFRDIEILDLETPRPLIHFFVQLRQLPCVSNRLLCFNYGSVLIEATGGANPMRHHGFSALRTSDQVKRSQLFMGSAFVSPRTGNTLLWYRHCASFYYLLWNHLQIEQKTKIQSKSMRKSFRKRIDHEQAQAKVAIYSRPDSFSMIEPHRLVSLSDGPEPPIWDLFLFGPRTCIQGSLSRPRISDKDRGTPLDTKAS
jgi:hypothetical protein